MGILGLPNLPIDFPTHAACQAVSAVSKSILNLAHEPQGKILLLTSFDRDQHCNSLKHDLWVVNIVHFFNKLLR